MAALTKTVLIVNFVFNSIGIYAMNFLVEPPMILKVNTKHKIQREAIIAVLNLHGLKKAAEFIKTIGGGSDCDAVRLNCPNYSYNDSTGQFGHGYYYGYQETEVLKRMTDLLWFESLAELDEYFNG